MDTICLLVVGFFGLVVVLDLLFLKLVRAGVLPNTSIFISYALCFFIGCASVGVMLLTPGNRLLKSATLSLFWAMNLMYMQFRSLLSRGYSLRMLIDLKKAGGTSSVAFLKTHYSDGKGVDGLVRKRLESLRRFGIIDGDAVVIEPLRWPATWLVVLIRSGRRLLRLDHVG